MEKRGTVTLWVHHELTPLCQLQPKKLLSHSSVSPHRSPPLPGLRVDYECRGPMWFLMRNIKGHFFFNLLQHFVFLNSYSCRFHVRRDEEKT